MHARVERVTNISPIIRNPPLAEIHGVQVNSKCFHTAAKGYSIDA